MNEIILAAKDVKKIYQNDAKEVRAVNGITLDVKRTESLAIVGASGAGKSTLLHMLGGLDRPTSGKVELEGVNVYKMSDKDRADARNNRIGFVFQFYHLLPEFTALENVMLPVLIKGPGPSARDKAADALKSVGLKDRINHVPGKLSGGESQRAAIARALINGPDILLCDEPTGNLDSKTSESIFDLLFNLKVQRNMALVIVTHDESIADRAEKVIRLKDGKVV